MDFRKKAGRLGETAAASFLESQGVRILLRNFYCRQGEIDLIAKEGEVFLAVEVKWRRNKKQGQPCEAVDLRKQRKICRAYDYFRLKYDLDEYVPARFDVVEVDGDYQCRWIKNAFEYHWP
ncbi:MAG: YraN family protein [Eubacteriales bacterium]|nr:YraN family protein [Eubacteriales bacterium]